MLACPEPALLERYADATCTAAEAAAVEAHVASCDQCRGWLSTAQTDDALLAELRAACADSGVPEADSGRVLPGLPGFRVRRQLGAGGMGVVYEAEQDTPRRRVALKVLRGGEPSPGALRRFELEREVLARLEHPGIARIHAAGTYDGNGVTLPFFAMELVHGEPLDAWLQSNRPDRDTRLCMFTAICAAVEHAHRRGVVHRDLKPGNVLVTADGEIKVVDFGVARLTDMTADDAGSAMRTEAGQFVGTLPYMSPEQVRGETGSIDTRTDVWALGVMLFEMLTGRLPHELAGLSRAEAGRRIATSTAPRLGTFDRRLRGDLETIVGKALRQDPDERYGSAGPLGDDVARCRRREPITAHPPSIAYQLRKLAARHRLLVGTCLLVLAAFVTAFVIARIERNSALLQASRAEAVVDILKEVLLQADPAQVKGGEPTIGDAVREAERRMQRHIPDDPWVEAVVRHTLARIQIGLGDYDEAQQNLDRALVAFREADAGRKHVAGALADSSELLLYRGKFREAEATALQALAIRTEAGNEVVAVAFLHNVIGLACQATGRLDDAERNFRMALDEWRSVEGQSGPSIGGVLANLGLVSASRGDLTTARNLYDQSLAILRTELGDDHPQVASTLGKLAGVQMQSGQYEEAEQTLRQVIEMGSSRLGPHHPDLATDYYNLGHLLMRAERFADAAEVFGNALVAAKRKGEAHSEVLTTLARLADALRHSGRKAEAIERLDEMATLAESSLGADSPGLFIIRAMATITRDDPDRDEQLRSIERSLLQRIEAADATVEQPLRKALARVYELWDRPEDAARVRR